VAILCGGRGARLQEHTQSIPKPLVQVGGRPILWHVISIHISQGFADFLLLTGYRGDRIAAFVADTAWPADVRIRCVDTGEDTPTGGRLRRAAGMLEHDRFCLAYADAVGDLNLGALIDHHDLAGVAATMAVVRPRLPFGVARLRGDGELVDGFDEKPVSDHWVNAGFFCLEPSVLSLLSDASVFEREPLSALAGDGQLSAFRHRGFWHCMDTYKDAVALNDLCNADPAAAPWLAVAPVGG
jgi:glucose-1-phosphate cytidylyltransferase